MHAPLAACLPGHGGLIVHLLLPGMVADRARRQPRAVLPATWSGAAWQLYLVCEDEARLARRAAQRRATLDQLVWAMARQRVRPQQGRAVDVLVQTEARRAAHRLVAHRQARLSRRRRRRQWARCSGRWVDSGPAAHAQGSSLRCARCSGRRRRLAALAEHPAFHELLVVAVVKSTLGAEPLRMASDAALAHERESGAAAVVQVLGQQHQQVEHRDEGERPRDRVREVLPPPGVPVSGEDPAAMCER